ncbi:MAG: GNAT family N-acetyltransferase [Desulforhopalus sp.]|nr:GNAT family N-acetyltransferase [Desulforhopalus sp.]
MEIFDNMEWKERLVKPDKIIEKITPGMTIFIGTGVSEPLTLFNHLKEIKNFNLDLDIFQLVSLGDAISMKENLSSLYRLKTFFSGWDADEAITKGLADFIPSRYYQIPELFRSKQINIDTVFIQITPPNEAGFCSLGVCVDVARLAMQQASFVVGEINKWMPRTFGDTFVNISDFDMLVEAQDPPIYFERWKVDHVYDKIAENVSSMIDDRSCIGFSIGPLYEALANHLIHKKDLGIHTPFFCDNMMDLVKSGAVTNQFKKSYQGKSLTSYAIGTPDLMTWLDNNPMVEFQSIEQVFNPIHISSNPKFVTVLPARKVDLYGRIALHTGRGNVGTGPGEVIDFFNGALLSEGGSAIFALPSRNRQNEPNIVLSAVQYPNQFSLWESVTTIVTEYGIASVKGRTVRERAQGLIDIAHPDDRPQLIEEARKKRIIYPDQIYIKESAHLYPSEIKTKHTFNNGLEVCFRAIKPSDEENMRRLFYRFSDESVYYRYFSRIRSMPHVKMQEYVNIDYKKSLSIVAEVKNGKLIAEARFASLEIHETHPEVAIVVDESYQNLGIATYVLTMLMQQAKERKLKGFKGYILPNNRKILRILEKIDWKLNVKLEKNLYSLIIGF